MVLQNTRLITEYGNQEDTWLRLKHTVTVGILVDAEAVVIHDEDTDTALVVRSRIPLEQLKNKQFRTIEEIKKRDGNFENQCIIVPKRNFISLHKAMFGQFVTYAIQENLH